MRFLAVVALWLVASVSQVLADIELTPRSAPDCDGRTLEAFSVVLSGNGLQCVRQKACWDGTKMGYPRMQLECENNFFAIVKINGQSALVVIRPNDLSTDKCIMVRSGAACQFKE